MSVFDILSKIGSLPMAEIERSMTEFPQVLGKLSEFLEACNGRLAGLQAELFKANGKLDALLAIIDPQIPAETILENIEATKADEDPRQAAFRRNGEISQAMEMFEKENLECVKGSGQFDQMNKDWVRQQQYVEGRRALTCDLGKLQAGAPSLVDGKR